MLFSKRVINYIRRLPFRTIISGAALGVLLLLAACSTRQSGKTEILWDNWGVPHIQAENADGVFYAFGWAQMESHGNLILKLYGRARGRAAEYWGETAYESDCLIRTMGLPERAKTWYQAQHEPMKSYLNSFVEGMNAYAEKHQDALAEESRLVLPVRPEDVLAHIQNVIQLAFIGNNLQRTRKQYASAGSNAWAIGPSRSASGNAMLLSNPHLPWSDLYLWYEAHLRAPGLNAYGATLIGMPVLTIAFNDHLGWTHTVNTLDGVDLYELTLYGHGYYYNGAGRNFESSEEIVKIKKEDGSFRKEKLIIEHSLHGPVLTKKRETALAVRMVGLDQPYFLEQYWQMIQATNLEEFETALKQLQIPFFNVIYADRDGHIMYLFNGQLPKRPQGDWNNWRGIVPGEDGTTLWSTTHPYSDLPRIVDPPNGWVQNTNDPPWSATVPQLLNPEDFPAYLSPQQMSLRTQRSLGMLTADSVFTFEELEAYKFSTRLELADRLLDDLIPAARRSGDPTAEEAADLLESWDRQTNPDSRGALLFSSWASEVGSSVFGKPWDIQNPRLTPDGLADPDSAVAALIKVADRMTSEFGSLYKSWGEVHRLRFGDHDYPAIGGPDWMGTFCVLYFSADQDGRLRATYGDSYMSVVEFSDPIRAKVLLSYGNSTQPDSPHRGDQLELFARKEMRPAWRTQAEIEAHLEKRETL